MFVVGVSIFAHRLSAKRVGGFWRGASASQPLSACGWRGITPDRRSSLYGLGLSLLWPRSAHTPTVPSVMIRSGDNHKLMYHDCHHHPISLRLIVGRLSTTHDARVRHGLANDHGAMP